MMRLLFLPGIFCTDLIWGAFRPLFSAYDTTFITYPHPVTQNSTSIGDLTTWIHSNFLNESYTAIVGHSLGGIIALELVIKYNISVEKIILLDTNLKPANAFYRNLMTPQNTEKLKDQVMPMVENPNELYHMLQSILHA